jgi:hypothetical protein
VEDISQIILALKLHPLLELFCTEISSITNKLKAFLENNHVPIDISECFCNKNQTLNVNVECGDIQCGSLSIFPGWWGERKKSLHVIVLVLKILHQVNTDLPCSH